MAEIASALALLTLPYDAAPALRVEETRDRTLVQLTAFDPAAVAARLASSFGLRLPASSANARAGEIEISSLAPRRWLITAPRARALGPELAAAIAPEIGTATDLTHAYAIVRVSGSAAREVLSEACPLDLEPAAFPPGAAARSTFFGHINALYRALGDGEFEICLPRSYARFGVELLLEAAASYGAPQRKG